MGVSVASDYSLSSFGVSVEESRPWREARLFAARRSGLCDGMS